MTMKKSLLTNKCFFELAFLKFSNLVESENYAVFLHQPPKNSFLGNKPQGGALFEDLWYFSVVTKSNDIPDNTREHESSVHFEKGFRKHLNLQGPNMTLARKQYKLVAN